MRFVPMLAVLGAALSALGCGPSPAAAAAIDLHLGQVPGGRIVAVRWECSPVSCIDSRSGAYTQSGCDAGGCHPTSGVIGYTDPHQARQDWYTFHAR